jgi:hypothetical protein
MSVFYLTGSVGGAQKAESRRFRPNAAKQMLAGEPVAIA